MSDAYLVIEQSKHMEGTLEVSGAKNATLPLMAATILTEEPCIIRNVPNLLDIKNMIELLSDMGKKNHNGQKYPMHRRAHFKQRNQRRYSA